ncbi:polysaccharide deacetylase family protein [Oceanobacillus chungangensis]|uniref:NodB homology domain-containing protein n=1 Tax=Oceanobacillus chungangensis TaxID=1229152 RepID=A0A3D8PQ11_9BACI|nr:polysaccharide deacetylase family protein [Oceanobacillus chungangensis]RDW17792.1 hypothetical protein CWR45_10690 [Oceanobacillus chungangensis]
MKHYRKYVNLFIFSILVILTFNSQYNPFQIRDVPIFSQNKKEDALYQEILEKQSNYHEEPQDAYIDDVWKKTPGRNGRAVDVDKSYEKMKDVGVFDDSLLVYKQIEPEISLSDLPASPIYRGHPEKKMVSLMINVSWGTEYIPTILKTLQENKVKATFFIEGKWAKENAELVKMIDEQGHIIGNHAYNHPDMARISNQKIVEQIAQTNDILSAITGKTPKWFAPPSGSFNEQVVQSAYNLKMETILWTVDTIDWKKPSVSVMMNRVNSKLHPGATILMHPTQVIAEGLDLLIKSIKENEYRIGTIDKLLSNDR